MEVNHKMDASGVTVELVGELGHHEALNVMKRLDEIIDVHTPTRLTLDLTGLSFMDSSGIAVLIKAFQACRDLGAQFTVQGELGAQFTVQGAPKQARKVLDAAGLNKVIQFVS